MKLSKNESFKVINTMNTPDIEFEDFPILSDFDENERDRKINEEFIPEPYSFIPDKTWDMNLNAYSGSLYMRLIFCCRNGLTCCILTNRELAKQMRCNEKKIEPNIKVLLDKNMIRIQKWEKQKKIAIFLTPISTWIQ